MYFASTQAFVDRRPKAKGDRIHFTALAPRLVSVILSGSCILRVFFSNPFGTPSGACIDKILLLGEVLAASFPGGVRRVFVHRCTWGG